jgi:hypothetical protein
MGPLVPFVWQSLQFTTLMALLYDLDGKVTMDIKEEDLANQDPELLNSTREAVRQAALKQHAFDMAGNIEYGDDGLPTGNVSFGESNIDLTKYKKQNLTSPKDGVPAIPENNGGYIYDPMDEWFTGESGIEKKGTSIFKKIQYVTPPEIRRKVAETASFVTGGAYKLK